MTIEQTQLSVWDNFRKCKALVGLNEDVSVDELVPLY